MIEASKFNQIQAVPAQADAINVKIKVGVPEQAKKADKTGKILGKDEFKGVKCQNYDKYDRLAQKTLEGLPYTKQADVIKQVSKTEAKYGESMNYNEIKEHINSNPKFNANYRKFLQSLDQNQAKKFQEDLKNGAEFPTSVIGLVAEGVKLSGGVV